MPMVAAAAAAAVTWVSSAAASAAALVATSLSVYGGVSIGVAMSITSFLGNMAVSALGSFAVNAIFAPRVNTAGSPISFKADPSSPIRGIMGRFGTAGTQNHFRVWGKDNLFISYSVILSLGPIQGIDSFTARGLDVTFPGAQGAAAIVEPFRDKMWMTYKMGLPTDGALGPPVGIRDGHVNQMSEWTANHRTSGYAGAFWTMKNNSKRASYEGGVPLPNWTVLGQKLYDPRKDSTQTAIGGSGSHRLDDWRTWEYSNNGPLHGINWCLGHHKKLEGGVVDRTTLLAGVGATIDKLDLPSMVAAANVSDANGWTISGEWNTQDDKWQVLTGMLQAGSAAPVHVGSKIGFMVNAPRAAVADITNDDIIGKMNLKVMASRRDRFNTVYPRYISEAQNWDYATAGAVTAATYLAQDDGEERSKEMTYNYVDKSLQAGQLAAYDLANTRETLKIAFPAKPHLIGVKPGDAVTVTSYEHGLDNQKFIVIARPIDLMEGTIGFELRSETDSKHAFALGQTDQPAPSPGLSGLDSAPSIPDEETWTVLPRPPSVGGGSQPGVIIGGEVPDGIGSVLIEYATAAVGPWVHYYDGPPTTEQIDVTGLEPDSDYWISITYRSVSAGIPSEPLILGPYTTPALVAGDTVNVGGTPSEIVIGRLTTAEELAEANAIAVGDLEEVFGDTVSAAASALAADASAVNAALSALTASGAADAAGDAADASVIQAGIATTQATNAGNSATAAQASRVASESAYTAAGVAVSAAFPETISGEWLTQSITGSPQTVASAPLGGGVIAAGVWTSAVAANTPAFYKAVVPYEVGKIYEVEAEIEAVAGSGGTVLGYVYGQLLNADYTSAGNVQHTVVLTVGQRTTIRRRFGFGILPVGGTQASGVVGGFVRLGALLNYGTAPNRQSKLYRLSVRDVTEVVAAEVQASAAVTSASSANTSAGLAGASATAASGSATTATTQAGNASTSASESSTSRDGAVAAQIAAAASAVTANSAAGTATTQAANASASASSASNSAVVAASISNRSLLSGSSFSAFNASHGIHPPGWSTSVGPGAVPAVNPTGGSAARIVGPAGANSFMQQDTLAGAIKENGYYVMEARIRLNAGTLRGAGILGYFAANPTTFNPRVDHDLRFSADPDNTGAIQGDGVVGQTYSFSKLVRATTPGSTILRLYAMTHYASYGTTAVANDMTWYLASVREATPAEIAAGTVLPALSASVATNTTVTTDLATRMASTSWSVTAASGGDPAQVYVGTTGTSSIAGLVASVLRFTNVVGGTLVDVMKLIGGNVFITGKLFLGALAQIELDPSVPAIIWKIGSAKLFIGQAPSDNLIFWFGPNMANSAMRKNNATFWLDSAGSAYFGGTLSSGVLKNAAQTSSTAALPEIETAVFGSNGGSISVNLSFSFDASGQASGVNPKPADTSGTNTGTVKLYRSVAGAAYVEVATLNASGAWSKVHTDIGFEEGINWTGVYNSAVGGSITFTDGLMSTQNRQYKATVTAKPAQVFGPIIQRLGIIATEG